MSEKIHTGWVEEVLVSESYADVILELVAVVNSLAKEVEELKRAR